MNQTELDKILELHKEWKDLILKNKYLTKGGIKMIENDLEAISKKGDEMEKVLDFLKENDMYADFGEDIIIFSKKNDEVFFIGTLDETLNFIEHYN